MISKEQIEHIAKLARIEINEQEKEKFTKELSLILDYVGKLKEVDVSKIESILQVTGLENIMREDKIKKGKNIRDKLLKEAPKIKGDHIKVPRILE